MKAETCGFLSWGAHQRNTKLGFPSSSTWQICMEMRYVCGLNSWNVTRATSSQVSWALYKCQEGSINYSKESGTVFLLGLLREWQEPGPKTTIAATWLFTYCPVRVTWTLFVLALEQQCPSFPLPAKYLSCFLGWLFPPPGQHQGDPAKDGSSIRTQNSQKIPNSNPNS